MGRKRRTGAGAIMLVLIMLLHPARAFSGLRYPGEGAAFAERERLMELFDRKEADAIPELVKALDAESLFIRRTAAHLLVRTGEPAINGMEKALENSDFQVRRIAIYGLARHGAVLRHWDRILQDEHPSIRREARLAAMLAEQVEEAGSFLKDKALLVFNGRDSYIKADKEVSIGTGNFTYELWFEPYRQTGHQGLMGSGRGDGPDRPGINLRYDPGGSLHFRAANDVFGVRLTGSAEHAGGLMHAAVSFERRSKVKMFLDGVLIGEADAAGFQDAAGFDAGPFVVGRRPPAGLWHFEGSISEVRVWRTARSQSEILKNMNRRLDGSEEGLLLYWPINEGGGDIVLDKTANRNNGKIVGASWK